MINTRCRRSAAAAEQCAQGIGTTQPVLWCPYADGVVLLPIGGEHRVGLFGKGRSQLIGERTPYAPARGGIRQQNEATDRKLDALLIKVG